MIDRRVRYLIALAALYCALGSGCGPKPDPADPSTKAGAPGSTFAVSVSEVPNVIFFGTGSNAATWLGSPVRIDSTTGKVELLSYSEGTAWGALCDLDIGKAIKARLGSNWEAMTLRDSIRSPELKAFWSRVRANWILTRNPDAKRDDFVNLFPSSETKHAEMVWEWVKDPAVLQDMDPRSVLGLSSKSLDAQAGVAVSDRFKAGFKAKDASLNFYVASIWGQLAIAPPFIACLRKAVDSVTPKKPTHIVTALSLGALFSFSAVASEVSAEAGASAGMVDVNATMDFSKLRLSARADGAIDPDKYKSLQSIVGDTSGTVQDKALLEYLRSFANSIDTPAFIAGNLQGLE